MTIHLGFWSFSARRQYILWLIPRVDLQYNKVKAQSTQSTGNACGVKCIIWERRSRYFKNLVFFHLILF